MYQYVLYVFTLVIYGAKARCQIFLLGTAHRRWSKSAPWSGKSCSPLASLSTSVHVHQCTYRKLDCKESLSQGSNMFDPSAFSDFKVQRRVISSFVLSAVCLSPTKVKRCMKLWAMPMNWDSKTWWLVTTDHNFSVLMLFVSKGHDIPNQTLRLLLWLMLDYSNCLSCQTCATKKPRFQTLIQEKKRLCVCAWSRWNHMEPLFLYSTNAAV